MEDHSTYIFHNNIIFNDKQHVLHLIWKEKGYFIFVLFLNIKKGINK